MALKKVTLDGIEYTQETLQKNVDGNIPYMNKIYGDNPSKVNYNANLTVDQLNFAYAQKIEDQKNKFGYSIIDQHGIPIDEDNIVIDDFGVAKPAPPPIPSTISPCEGVPWVEVSRKFKASSISGRLVLYNKYRLPFKYDKKNEAITFDGVNDVVSTRLSVEFLLPTSKIISLTILDLDSRRFLKDGISYRIDNNNFIWIKGTRPYKNLLVTVEWYDTRQTPWEYNISEFNSQTILDTGVLNNKVNNKVYVVTQSQKTKTPEYTWFESLIEVAKYNTADQSISGLKFANTLGPWRQPVLYTINDGECHVKVEIDGKFTYLNSNGAPTTPESIFSNTLSRINLLATEINEFQTGQIIDGKYTKGLFQIIEPDNDSINYKIQRDNSFSQKTGIKKIHVKVTDEKVYETWSENASELKPGLRMFIDVRKREPVPYRDCYDGLRTEYVFHEEYEIKWERKQPCIADLQTGEVVMQYRTTTEKVTKTLVDWEDQVLNNSLADCECLDIIVENDTVQTEVPDCGCREITTANFYKICRGGIRDDIFKMYAYAADKDKKVYGMPEPPVLPYIQDKIVKIAKCKSVPLDLPESLVYHKFIESDVIKGHIEMETHGLFNSQEYVDCYVTSSNQTEISKDYYYDVVGCDDCDKSKPYFSVWYGNIKGSGSLFDEENNNKPITKAIYTQNKLMALDSNEKEFIFYDNGILEYTNDIYAIKFYRNHFGDKIDIGNFELNLVELSGSSIPNNIHTGSNVKVSGSNPKLLSLVDNSIYVNETYCVENAYYSYDLVSGSLDDGIHDSGTGSIDTNFNITTYGKVYPALGLIVLSGKRLNQYLSFNSVTGSNIAGDNAYKLFTSISGAASIGQSMKSRRVKSYGTNYYYVRVPFTEANYSNNPTSVIDDNILKYPCSINQPFTYVTAIGLYDDSKNLLAVAKLSSPVKKSYDEDLFVKIKLGK